MGVEGFFFRKSEEYSSQDVAARYSQVAFAKNGFIGTLNEPRLANYSYSTFACIVDDHGEKTFLSNDTQKVFSSFFSQLSRNVSDSLFGAVANFDEPKQLLYLARELFGRCPLYYICVPHEFIAFSTDLRSLTRNSRVRRHISINNRRIASYAEVARDAGKFYHEHTFYDNIKSVLPGHSLELSLNGTIKSSPFVTFSPSRWSHLQSIEEFGEEFQSKFAQSVNRCVESPSLSISSHLSGGLDSTSVSGMFRHLFPERSLHTLYNRSNTMDTDEHLFVRQVAKQIGSSHHEVIQSEEDFSLMSTYISLTGLPSSTLISPAFPASLMHYAQSLGCNVVMNGGGGDSIAGSGLEMIIHSFQNRDWKLVEELLRKRVKYYTLAHQHSNWNGLSEDQKYHRVLQNFLYKRLSTKFLSSSLSEFQTFYSEVAKNLPISYRYFAAKSFNGLLNKLRKKQFKPSTNILRQEIASELSELTEGENDTLIKQLLETNASDEAQQSFKDIYSYQTILANEQNYALSRHYQIANVSPFYDKELFELCMAVPNLLKFGDGIGRSHFRQAMKGITPETVRTRSTKTHIGTHGQDIIERIYRQAIPILADSKELWHLIDRKGFEQEISFLHNKKIPYTQKFNTWFLISRTISLAIWLDQNKA